MNDRCYCFIATGCDKKQLKLGNRLRLTDGGTARGGMPAPPEACTAGNCSGYWGKAK